MSSKYPFRLRFELTEIDRWAAEYDARLDAEVETDIGPQAKAKGFVSLNDLQILARWKSPRIGKRMAANPIGLVQEATRVALSTSCEEMRIGALMILQGVSWPMASVVLHFAHREPYPILDVRALWSLNVGAIQQYSFEFWWSYTEFCRELAREAECPMRTLDRALWQYSKANQ